MPRWERRWPLGDTPVGYGGRNPGHYRRELAGFSGQPGARVVGILANSTSPAIAGAFGLLL